MAGLLPDESQRAGRERLYADNLRFAAGECAAAGLILLIEPINTRDIPGYFLNYQDQARRIIEAVVLPTCSLDLTTARSWRATSPAVREFLPLAGTSRSPACPDGTSPTSARSTTATCSTCWTSSATRRLGRLRVPAQGPHRGRAGLVPTLPTRVGGQREVHGMARQPSAEVRTAVPWAAAAALGERMTAAAAAFAETLDAPQRPHALHRFDGAARRDWGYTPRVRPGLPLRAMREAQRKAAWTLVDAALSAEGAAKARASWRWRQSCRSARPTGPTATPRTTRSPCSASQAEALGRGGSRATTCR